MDNPLETNTGIIIRSIDELIYGIKNLGTLFQQLDKNTRPTLLNDLIAYAIQENVLSKLSYFSHKARNNRTGRWITIYNFPDRFIIKLYQLHQRLVTHKIYQDILQLENEFDEEQVSRHPILGAFYQSQKTLSDAYKQKFFNPSFPDAERSAPKAAEQQVSELVIATKQLISILKTFWGKNEALNSEEAKQKSWWSIYSPWKKNTKPAIKFWPIKVNVHAEHLDRSLAGMTSLIIEKIEQNAQALSAHEKNKLEELASVLADKGVFSERNLLAKPTFTSRLKILEQKSQIKMQPDDNMLHALVS